VWKFSSLHTLPWSVTNKSCNLNNKFTARGANSMPPGNYYTNILSANHTLFLGKSNLYYQIAKQCANVNKKLKAVCIKVTPIVRKCTQGTFSLPTKLLGRSRCVSSVACAQSLQYSQCVIMSAAPIMRNMLYSDSLVIRAQTLSDSLKSVSKIWRKSHLFSMNEIHVLTSIIDHCWSGMASTFITT
jgi:hypothetical protein